METPNEERTPVADSGLENLSAADKAETESILAEIEAEKAPAPEAAKPEAAVPPKPEGEKPPETPAAPKPEAQKPPEPERRREAKLVPEWQLHAAVEKNTTEWEAKVAAAVEEAKKGLPPQPAAPGEVSPTLESEAKAIAEKTGIDVEAAKLLLESASRLGGKLPDDLRAKLEAFDKMKEDGEIAAETARFNADFDRSIIPLIKAEYGDTTPPERIEEIRDTLKGLAYSDAYGKVPYQTIYKGEDQFRNIIPVPTRGAEPAHLSGAARVEAGEAIDLTKPLPDDVVKDLSDTQFEAYEKNMIAYEKTQKTPQS